MKKKNLLVGLFLFLVILMSMAGCGNSSQDASESETKDNTKSGAVVDTDVLYTIGVAVFDESNPEMRMFLNYYRDYLEQGFPVKFYYSDTISSTEDEIAFIHAMKDQGAKGVISFYGLDVESVVAACEEDEMYYILASGTISDEAFDAVKENPWFLGTVGPEGDAEYQAGVRMAEQFADASRYLVMTGGADSGNFMHASRTQGVLDKLQELHDGDADVEITTCPGYMTTEEGMKNLEDALAAGDYDAVLCTYGISDVLDKILDKESQQGENISVGTIDCFSEDNFQAIKKQDAFGNPQIDFVEGKYASMVGPAFAILYNAMTDHPEANTEDGQAVRLYQGFWTAAGREEYVELYGYTQGIYENAYDCNDLMNVIKVFNEDTDASQLKALTEAYTVEDVKSRIATHE